MNAVLRRTAPVLVFALALAGCGSSKKHTESFLTSFRAPAPYSLPTLEREPYGCAKSNEQCAIRYLRKLTKRYGPRASLGVLGSLERRGLVDPTFDTHQLAHLVGEATAKRFGANKRAFGLCPNSFNYGCVHGFFIYVLGRSDTPSQAANRICRSGTGGPLVPTFSCYHGVGHGVMMARGNDLKASLAVCNSLGTPTAADGCWQGVFMENVNAQFRNQARPGVFSRAHPLRPCTRVAAEYRHECYINQAGWLADVADDDIGKAAAYCLQASGAYVSVCAQSLGLMVTNPSWQVPFIGPSKGRSFEQIAWTLCTRFPTGLQRDCVLGGVDNLANFDQLNVTRSAHFCALTAPRLQPTCYREIGVNVARRTTDMSLARSLCDSLPTGHQSDCRAGVDQGQLPSKAISVPLTRGGRQAQPAAKPSATVHMTDAGFSPRTLTIRQGQTVEFANDSTRDYWPASNPHPIHTGYPGFDALTVIHPGGSWSFTFKRAGRFGYHNHLSPETRGVIAVKRAS